MAFHLWSVIFIFLQSCLGTNANEDIMYTDNTCYVIHLSPVTWTESKDWCKQQNMELAVIDTMAEMNVINNVMNSSDEWTEHIFQKLVWVEAIEFNDSQMQSYNCSIPSGEDCGYTLNTMCETFASKCREFSRSKLEDACDKHPEVINADTRGNMRHVGAKVSLTCKGGYVFPEGETTKTVVCDGSNWIKKTPGCQVERCPLLGELPAYTSRDRDDNHIGANVTYYCAAGFSFPDDTTTRTLVCQQNKIWSHREPVCEASACRGGIKPGEKTQITCPGNKRLYNGLKSARFVCTPEKTLYPDPTCYDNMCPPVPWADNTTLVSYNLSLGGLAVFRCIKGHSFPSGERTKTISCRSPGEWSQNFVEACVETTCPVPTEFDHAKPTYTTVLLGDVVTYTCEHGSIFNNKNTTKVLTCLWPGNWSEPPTDCRELTCGAHPELPGAIVGNNNAAHDATIKYTCEGQGRFPDGRTYLVSRCTYDETWDVNENITCKENRCPPVPEVANATRNAVRNTDEGTKVSYTCTPGYGVQGAPVMQNTTCTSSLTWTPPPVDCQLLSCPKFPNESNGHVTGTSHRVFSSVEITCGDGFELTNGNKSATVTCLTSQTWSMDQETLKCQEIKCDPVPDLDNAETGRFGVHRYRDQVPYTCKRGYETLVHKDKVVASCNHLGKWILDSPRGCLRIVCPLLAEWNGIVVNTSLTTYGTTVNFTCAEGYAFPDRWQYRFAECVRGSRWKPPIVDCVEKPKEKEEPVPTEAPNAQNYGTVAIILMTLIVGFVMSLDLISFYQYVQEKRQVKPVKTKPRTTT